MDPTSVRSTHHTGVGADNERTGKSIFYSTRFRGNSSATGECLRRKRQVSSPWRSSDACPFVSSSTVKGPGCPP
ncbi:hypothetical protein BHE74_00021200 [Ensete ventricosum]|nr:hypothetical protein BHE74_00021200 [Ensete ventricosum]RZS01157.1 hypothetical protein BHM03_00030975 [Ensete ventricosum]